jgi:hypothetical protein
MLTAHEWAQKAEIAVQPWLILGKGPSFSKVASVDPGAFATLALNHAARDVKCDAALMMDFDVFEACGEAIAANARYVLLPWRPHFAHMPTSKTLAHLVAENPLLTRLDAEGRLVLFNAQSARDFAPHPREPITDIKFFSAEAALNILADNGVQVVRTLGVDGGAQYASTFNDLAGSTLLANGRTDFDKQFTQFAQTLRRHPELTFGPLDVQTPVRFFIGADATQILGARLFEYSVRRFASISTRFDIIDNAGLPEPTDPQRRARTGFSFCRFKIPELCRHRGRAIYVDADMQVFSDVRDLWTRDFEEAWLLYSEALSTAGRVPQYSVMLLDCAKLGWDAKALVEALDRGEYDYKGLMHDFSMMAAERKRAGLEFAWNSLETYSEGETKLIHYTDMPTQPWVSNKNKNGEVWYAEVRRALADKFITREEIDAEIARGHISPMLPTWAGLEPYPDCEALAARWTPPFKRFTRKAA